MIRRLFFCCAIHNKFLTTRDSFVDLYEELG